MNVTTPRKKLFALGSIVATPDALRLLADTGKTVVEYLRRHENGDWGDLCEEDRLANQEAVDCGYRILSCYHPVPGARLWIITEADRSVTTLLLQPAIPANEVVPGERWTGLQ